MKKGILTIVAGIVAILTTNAQSNVYVDVNATGLNNGSSWSNAFIVLDSAIAHAAPGDHILIKAGIYKQYAELGKGVQIHGGFDGTETSYTEADPVANPVVFDADVNGDDIAGDYVTNKGDNMGVLLAIQTYNASSFTASISGITFKNARRLSYSGSAIFLRTTGFYSIEVTFQNCRFIQNCNVSAGQSGGIGGGAVCVEALNGGSVYGKFDKCLFEGNSDQSLNTYGSAASIWAGTNGTVQAQFTNCVFTGNSDVGNNGGNYVIYQAGSSSGNSNTYCALHVYNCTFYNNNNSKAVLFWNGSSTSEFAAVFNRNIIGGGDSSMVIGNVATASNNYNISASSNYWLTPPTDFVGTLSGSNNITGNAPGFVNAASGDFNLMQTSPCLDVQAVPPSSLMGLPDTLDYAGNNRFVGPGIDIGAFEYQGGNTFINDLSGPAAFKIYPNPATESINVDLSDAPFTGNSMQILVCDAMGNVLISTALNQQNNVLDISGLSSGMYFIHTTSGKAGIFIKK